MPLLTAALLRAFDSGAAAAPAPVSSYGGVSAAPAP